MLTSNVNQYYFEIQSLQLNVPLPIHKQVNSKQLQSMFLQHIFQFDQLTPRNKTSTYNF